jgi:hypothetical protein
MASATYSGLLGFTSLLSPATGQTAKPLAIEFKRG